MGKVIVGVQEGSYVFDASAQTVTISGITGLSIQMIQLIINQTDGIYIYSPLEPTKGGVLAGTILTLQYDTTTMSDTDVLIIHLCTDLTIPTQFVKDSVVTDAEIDTATPANNEPLPVAMYNPNGLQGTNMNPFGVSIFDKSTGARAIVDQNGAIKFGEAVILVGDVLYGQALSTLLWSELSINGGSTIGGSGEEILQTGTTANGEIILQSKKRSRFMISQFNISHFGLQLNSDVLTDPNVIVEWGAADYIDDTVSPSVLNATPNGAYMRVTGHATDPVWQIISIKEGVETSNTLEVDWNGANIDNFNASPGLSVYEMQYNAGTVIFFQGSNFIHRIGGLSETYSGNYHLPVFLRIRNINGSTTNRSIGSRAAGTYRLGEERGEVIPRAFTASQLIKTGAGYVATASLSRNGSAGGSGKLELFDGTDNTGISMGVIDVGGDDIKGHAFNGTYSFGLYIEITGSGNNTANLSFE